MKADEPAMKYQKFLIFVASLSLFICDIMIKVSNMKEIPSILTIDLNFLFKIKWNYLLENFTIRGFQK